MTSAHRVFAALPALALTAAAALVSPTLAHADVSAPDPIVIGHRGVKMPGTPENTLTAFRASVAGGATVLETDVQWTKDRKMVLLHDETLTRTTNCTGKVEDKTLTSIRKCKTDIDGKPVATFDELLTYADGANVDVDAELKLPGLTVAEAQTYVDLIAKHGVLDHVIATSFYTSNLNRLKSASGDSRIRRGIIDFDHPHTAQEAAERGSIVAPNLDHTDAARVAEAHAAGLLVYVWTLRTDAEYARAKSLGVDGIITDDPAGLTKWLATH